MILVLFKIIVNASLIAKVAITTRTKLIPSVRFILLNVNLVISDNESWPTDANIKPRTTIIDILKKNKKASLLFYDKEEKIQLRVKVECEVNNQNSTTNESWKKTQHISRRCYLTDSPPGTASQFGKILNIIKIIGKNILKQFFNLWKKLYWFVYSI